MGNQVDKKFTWVIKDFCSLRSKIIYSEEFVIDGCKWRLMAYPCGDRKWNKGHMSLYLDVADSQYLPFGWRRHAKFTLKVVNQLSRKDSIEQDKNNVLFDQKTLASGFEKMIRKCDIFHIKGFLVNGEVKIVVEIDLLEVIGKVNVPEESDKESEEEDESEKESEEEDESEKKSDKESENEDESEKESEEEDESEKESESEEESEETGRVPLKKMKLNNNDGAVSSDDDIHNETQQERETVSVHGFHVLPSQVELVSRIFKKYPDIALECHAKNQHLRTACVNVLLSLIETLCQSPQELSNEDLAEAYNALTHVKASGFKVDWLEKKLAEVKERKEEEQTGEARIQEFEEELKDLEALLEKEKAKVLAARASLTLDDFV